MLKNKLNIEDPDKLFVAEKRLTFLRLKQLKHNPIEGNFDFAHLKAIHRYIFQDIYDWAGKERTVEIGKGNIFCLSRFIQSYADSVFGKYYTQCWNASDDKDTFINVFAQNYADLNALHPFREGNGRAQREFARLVCHKCGYYFNLSVATHHEMLEASKLSFEKDDISLLVGIFSKAVTICDPINEPAKDFLNILTSDDLTIGSTNEYDYYDYEDQDEVGIYDNLYQAKIDKMNAEKVISDAREELKSRELEEVYIVGYHAPRL